MPLKYGRQSPAIHAGERIRVVFRSWIYWLPGENGIAWSGIISDVDEHGFWAQSDDDPKCEKYTSYCDIEALQLLDA